MADAATALDPPDPLDSVQPSAAPPRPSASDALMSRIAEGQKKTEGILAAEQREKGPAIDAAIAENRKPGPAVPKLGRETEPPKSNMQQEMQDWLMPMVALSALAGVFSRQHATTALNAFAAGVNGLKEGNLQLYDQKLKEWKAANEKMLANNDAALKEYNAAWNNKKNNIDQKMNEIQLIAAKYQDQLTYEASSQKNFTLVAQMLQKQENLHEKMQLQYDKLKATADSNEAKLQLAIRKSQMGQIDDDSLKQMVGRRLAGDKTVLTNMGRGAQGPENIARFNQMLAAEMQARGITGEQLAKIDQQYGGGSAYQRTAGGQAARIEVASNEVEQALPQAIEASHKLPRGKIVPLNKLIQDWERGTSDPLYNDFIMANFALINSYTRAMNPQGVPRIAERLEQQAIGILSTATSQEAYDVQARRLWKEVQGSKKAVAATREGVTGGDINAPVPGLDTPKPGTGGGQPDPLGIR